MKFFKLAFAVIAITFMVIGCKEAVPLDKSSFQAKWEESINHSAVSWRYLGETTKHYFIAEDSALTKTIYSIEKEAVRIIGITSFEYDSGNSPINLKNENIVFQQPAS